MARPPARPRTTPAGELPREPARGATPSSPGRPASGERPAGLADLPAVPPHLPGPSLSEPWKANVFRLAALAVVAWLAILVWLVLTTANPAVLSIEQLESADALVTAHRTGPSTLVVDQVWFGPVPKSKQNVVNLSDLGDRQVPVGERQFCVPLSLRNGRWWVTSLGNAKPRIYPASKAYLDLLREYVRSHPRQQDETRDSE